MSFVKMENTRTLIEIYAYEVINNKRLDLVEAITGDEFIDPAAIDNQTGPDGFRKTVLALFSIFDDLKLEIVDIVISEYKVAWVWKMSAIHAGSFLGIAPTGRNVSCTGIIIDEIKKGKIVKRQGCWDRLQILQQITSNPYA